MLGKRYLISGFDIRELSAMNAIQVDENDKVDVKIEEKLVPAIRTITKANCALFQVLEKLNDPNYSIKPQEEVSVRFLREVCVVSFPRDCDAFMFADNNQGQHTGKELRELIYKNGFMLGDTEMQSAFAGAGFMREGKELFVSKRFRDDLMKELTLGVLSANESGELQLNLQDDYALHMSKLLAYIGLAGSSGQAIDELQAIYRKKTGNTAEEWAKFKPNSDSVVLVKDVNLNVSTAELCPFTVKNNINVEKRIELQMVKDANPKLNLTDGCGLIDPQLAEEITLMQQARKPGYPNHKAYIVRWPFIKGVLTSFDFKRYLKAVSGREEIKDAFGKLRKIENIKIILPISMVKGLDYFRMLRADAVTEEEWKDDFEGFAKKTAKERHDSDEVTEAAWNLYLSRLAKSQMASMIITGADSISTRNQTSLNIQTFSTVSPGLEAAKTLCEEDFSRIERMKSLLDYVGKKDLKESDKKEIVKTLGPLLVPTYQEEEIGDDIVADDEPSQEDPEPGDNPGNAGSTTEPSQEEPSRDVQESAGESLDEMVVRFIKEYPTMINHTEIVDTVKDALFRRVMDLALCRITVEGQVRMLIADPFEFLDHIVAETNGVISSHKLAHPINRESRFYAPGIEAEKAVLLRCPHLSPLESVVLESVRQSDDSAPPQEMPDPNEKSGIAQDAVNTADPPQAEHDRKERKKPEYKDYLSQHTGIAIAPAAVLSALGGADMDGDRIFVVTDKNYMQLVEERQNAIKELLKQLLAANENNDTPDEAAEASADKDEKRPIALRQLQFPKNAVPKPKDIEAWKILPTVTIQGQSKSKGAIPVSEMKGKAFIDKAFGCYESSINGKVGYYSNRATAIALNHMEEFTCGETDSKKLMERLNTLWRLTSFSIAVGLDIDSAKTGYMPQLDSAVKGEVKDPALLQFSKVRKKISGKISSKYHIALEAVDKGRYNALRAKGEADSKAAKVTCTADLLLYGKELVSTTFPKGTSAKTDVIGRKKKGETLSDAMMKAVEAAADAFKTSKQQSQAISESFAALKKYDTQRKLVLGELLNRYPLDEVWTLMGMFEATLAPDIADKANAASTANEVKAEDNIVEADLAAVAGGNSEGNAETKTSPIGDVDLGSDESLMKYVLKTPEELKKELEANLFGKTDVKDVTVIYDISTLILLKALQRWRGATADYDKAVNQLGSDPNKKNAWRLSVSGIRKKMREIAQYNKVERMDIGKELLRAGKISLLQYILIFFGDSDPIAPQNEEPKPQEGEENVQ